MATGGALRWKRWDDPLAVCPGMCCGGKQRRRTLSSAVTLCADSDCLRFTCDGSGEHTAEEDTEEVMLTLPLSCITAVDLQLIGLCEAHISRAEQASEFVLAVECWCPAGEERVTCEWPQQPPLAQDLEKATLVIVSFPFTGEQASALVSIVNSIRKGKPAIVGTSGVPTWMLGRFAPAFGPSWRVTLMRAKAAVSLFSAMWACWLLYQNSRQVQDALRHAHTYVIIPLLLRAEELSKPVVDTVTVAVATMHEVFSLYTEWVWQFVLPIKHILEQLMLLPLMNMWAILASLASTLTWPLFAALRDGLALIWPVLAALYNVVMSAGSKLWAPLISAWGLAISAARSPAAIAAASAVSAAGSLLWRMLSPLVQLLQAVYALAWSVGSTLSSLLYPLAAPVMSLLQKLYASLSALAAAFIQLSLAVAAVLKPAGKTLETFQAESQKQYVSIFFSGLWARTNTVVEFMAGRGQHEWHNLFEISASPHASPPLVRRQPTHRQSGGGSPSSGVLSPAVRTNSPQRRRSSLRLSPPTSSSRGGSGSRR